VVLVRFRLAAGHRMAWQPGQYTEITIPDAPELTLPYSIASVSDPSKPDEFELALSSVGGQKLLEALPLGAHVLVAPARGKFVWEPAAGPALFIGIGTGIAPLRAMLNARLLHPSRERTVLLFGARAETDLLFREELELLTQAHTHFSFEPTLSRPVSDWCGRTGRVQSHLPHVLSDLRDPSAYVCGNRSMVNECVARLTELGVDPVRIRSEAH
jgi:NAD(P)H-flavin reductase